MKKLAIISLVFINFILVSCNDRGGDTPTTTPSPTTTPEERSDQDVQDYNETDTTEEPMMEEGTDGDMGAPGGS